jgi:antitoxin Phd
VLSLQDAKNRFSAVVEAALAGRPQQVSRRGKPVVVVLAAEEYDRLVQAAKAKRGTFQEHLMGFPTQDVPRSTGDVPRGQVRPRNVEF